MEPMNMCNIIKQSLRFAVNFFSKRKAICYSISRPVFFTHCAFNHKLDQIWLQYFSQNCVFIVLQIQRSFASYLGWICWGSQLKEHDRFVRHVKREIMSAIYTRKGYRYRSNLEVSPNSKYCFLRQQYRYYFVQCLFRAPCALHSWLSKIVCKGRRFRWFFLAQSLSGLIFLCR